MVKSIVAVILSDTNFTEKIVHGIVAKEKELVEPAIQDEKISELKNKITQLEASLTDQNLFVAKLENSVKVLKDKSNHLEQYGRLHYLRIHNVLEIQDENVPNIVMNLATQMKVELHSHSISVCYRTGQAKSGKPRQIIVKFCARSERNSILYGCSSLGSSNPVFISEDFTKLNMDMLIKAKNRLGSKNVFTRNGRIYEKQVKI
ncbi:unnamed protein product [Didymodactylos carnosus]|uniref:Uncharacterized protein n=1 Tax=Didymodactylos carnosus TaxID=1234261 RepID=A0A815JF25_9BILA|nr:unnamed protein product [Didymodactylos carnosus]CAF1377073.1 unnamed protein product [Didymodactylos carnosus]CAF4021956.1 unnamed protein product [Didymodactylos carnosus]CAF4268211.1 unnamed protein product [Didymodactylos carnosus]